MKYLEYNVKQLHILALYNNTDSILRKIYLYAVRIVISFSMFYVSASSVVNVVCAKWNNFAELANSAFYVAVGIICLFHFIYYNIFNDKTGNLVGRTNKLFKYETNSGVGEKSMKYYNNLSTTLCKIYLYIGLCVGEILFVLSPLFSKDRILPFFLIFPYDWKISPIYECLLIYEGFCQLILIVTYMSTSSFFATLILLTTRQFELLGWEIRNCIFTVLINNGIDKNLVLQYESYLSQSSDCENQHTNTTESFQNITELLNSPKYITDLSKRFNELIKFHQLLTIFCLEMNQFFTPLNLVDSICILFTAILSAILFILVDDMLYLMLTGAYFALASFVIFITSYLGELLKTKSEDIQFELYSMPWYVCNKHFLINFKIMHNRTNRPINLSVGKFVALDLNVFLWSMKTTASYITVLRQLIDIHKNKTS